MLFRFYALEQSSWLGEKSFDLVAMNILLQVAQKFLTTGIGHETQM